MTKRRNTHKSASIRDSIPPTVERQQQNGGIIPEAIDEKNDGFTYKRRHRARFECILDAYFWHGRIDKACYAAGLKFRRDYSRAILKVKIYENGSGNHGDVEMPTLSGIQSHENLRKAYEILSAPQRNVIISVCGDNHAAGSTRKLKYLQDGLRLLAKHWKILAD